MSRLTCFAGVSLVMFFIACKKTPDKIISINPSTFTTAQQIEIGEAFQHEIEANPEVFDVLGRQAYPEAYQYLTVLFNTVLNTAPVQHRNDYEWTMNIVRNDTMRTAFFLPGGHFYIYTGLLKYLDRESQLLALIGHEVFYVDSDVLIKKMSSEFGGTILGDIILGNEVEKLGNMAASMPFVSFSEPDVLEADSFAVQVICPFQYEPHGIKTILEMENPHKTGLLWLTTRKAHQAFRIRRIEQLAAHCGYPGIGNAVGYKKFKEEYLP